MSAGDVGESAGGVEQPAGVRRRRVQPSASQPPPEVVGASPSRASAVAESIIPAVGVQAPPRGEGTGDFTPPALGPWGVLVEDVLRVDVGKSYQRLKDELALGEGATEYGVVLAAVDRAESNFQLAVLLARKGKLERERVERLCDVKLEVLRTTALRELELEKADGKKSRAPTLDDISNRMLANWPEAVGQLQDRKAQVHAFTSDNPQRLGVLDGLVEAWRSRCATLRAVMERVAPGRL